MSDVPVGVGKEILYEKSGAHIGIVTLNRPDKRNAVNAALTQAFQYLVALTESDPDIRVVVLATSNDKAFCAGADLAEVAEGGAAALMPKDGGFAGFVHAKRRKPWIAAIRGAALAGGCELALACDLIVASDETKFGLPEVKRGLFAAAGGVYRLPRALPRAIALELIVTGDTINAQRAYDLGLINRKVPLNQVDKTALALATTITENAPCSVIESLAVARLAPEMSDAALRELSDSSFARISATEDSREGPRAFVEKRAPVWKGC